ncbi:hypothetical protein KDX05_06990 [Burkholderia vietnamiensis]|uniref:hypothetical protein n=1 Tax=Burkholderia vietnamiensis TaxID=60552 RepID=UPI001B907602|nr:hypothetical protein [Burkholderia vietnamiensis]MBR8228056.1 hypothetical protein [Burkholderia vietnamiensis]
MTTENSRADALTDAVWRLKRDLERGNMGAGTCLVYMADLRALLAASPVEQPAPSPADERAAPCGIVSHPGERVSMTITQYAELQRASAMLDWLEHQIRQRGMHGVSFDWVPSVDGEPSGYRYMRRHFIAEPKKTLRAAIDEAQRSEK